MEFTRNSLKKHGLSPDALLDQHFAVDEKMLKSMIRAADLKKNDVVLEIGPGSGNLTRLLVKTGARVIAVEADGRFRGILEELKSERLDLVFGDGLEAMRRRKFSKIVSNIPYSICEALVRASMRAPPEMIVITVPVGFSDTLMAKKGDMNFTKLTLYFRCFFDAKIISVLPKSAFYPEPKTQTALLKITPLKPAYYRKHKDVFIMREMFLHPGRKLKKTLMESLICWSRLSGKGLTKNESKKMVGTLPLKKSLLEKRVNDLGLEELLLVREKVNP